MIRSAVTTATGTGRIVVEQETYSANQSANTISAQWTIFLPAISSNELVYSETVQTSDSKGQNPIKLWDGKDHTYAFFNQGARKTMRQTISVETQKKPSHVGSPGVLFGLNVAPPGGIGLNSGRDLFNLFGTISIRDRPASSGKGGSKGGGGGAGRWVLLNEDVQTSSNNRGKTIEGGGAQVKTYTKVTVRDYIFAVAADPIQPKFGGQQGLTESIKG